MKASAEEKAKKKLVELKEFAKVAHSLAEVRHLIEVPFSGHVMADSVLYLNQKMLAEGRVPDTTDDIPDGTLPFRNYPKTKNPRFQMDFRSYDRKYGPHIPYHMLTGEGQVRQIRDCFPPYEKVLEKIEEDLKIIKAWLETHPKYGTRMRKSLETALGNFNVAKNLKLACQLPRPVKDPYDTLHDIAIPRIGVALSALKDLSKMFDAKADRLIDSLPESEWNAATAMWRNETKITFRHNPKVPYHLSASFGEEIDDSPTNVSQDAELAPKESSPSTPEEDFAEVEKVLKALGELRFLLLTPLAAHSGLDLLVSEPSLKELFFEEGAPKNAAQILRKALPSYEFLQLLAIKRVDVVMDWLKKHPTLPMIGDSKETCLEVIRTVRDAVIKSKKQRKWANDMENGLMVEWRSRLKDTAFLNIDDCALAVNEVCLSLAAPFSKMINKLPEELREKPVVELLEMYFPTVRPNEKIPAFVKERWRNELILEEWNWVDSIR